MGHFHVLLALTLLVALAFILSVRRTLSPRYRWPYRADQTYLSPAQQRFLAVLERVLGEHHYQIHGRVRAADIIGIQRRIGRRWRLRAERLLGESSFDFLICRASTGAIACAVALGPRSRWRPVPGRRRLERICRAAGLPLVRVREAAHYDEAEMTGVLLTAMGETGPGQSSPRVSRPISLLKDGEDVRLPALGEGAQSHPEPRLGADDVALDDEPRFDFRFDLDEDGAPERVR